MADGTTAADRLARLLHILPAASVEGGARLADLARDLDVDEQTVADDITEVTARSYYHPAGSGDDIQITLEADRVTVWTTGAFRRPVKLSPVEAFCLALGLRGMRHDDGAAAADLLRRVEEHLASGVVPEAAAEGVHATDAAPDPDGVRELLAGCARDRLRCRIRYLKPTDEAPEDRVIHPYAVAHAEGAWYAVGWCERAGDGRAFRLDRVLEADACPGTFEVRDDVEVGAFLSGGRVYHHGGEETEAVVRYSSDVARWVAERSGVDERADDGSLILRHRVADPGWLVDHVLGYAGEAEVVEPESFRMLLRDR